MIPFSLSAGLFIQRSSESENNPPFSIFTTCKILGSKDTPHMADDIGSAGVIFINRLKVCPTPTVFSPGSTDIVCKSCASE